MVPPVFAFLCLFVLLLWPDPGRAQTQPVWRFTPVEAAGIGSADAIEAGRPKLAVRCRKPGRSGPLPGRAGAETTPGAAVLMLAPEGGDSAQKQPRRFRFAVSGRETAAFVMVYDVRERAMVAPVLIDSPFLAKVAAGGGSLVILDWQGRRRAVSLTGAGAALRALAAYCAPPGAALRPAMDCAGARTPSAEAVCTHPELAELDRRMAADLQQAAAGGTGTSALAQEQARWAGRVAACGAFPYCIAQQYRARLQQLAAGAPGARRPREPSQAAAPASPVSRSAAAAVRTGRTLSGLTAVSRVMGLWLLGQRPGLLENGQVSHQVSNALRRGDLPPGFPAPPQQGWTDPGAEAAYLQAIGRRAAQIHLPQQVVLDIPVQLRSSAPGLPQELQFLRGIANPGLEHSIPAAIRTLQVQAEFDTGRMRLIEQAPLALPLPAALAAPPAALNRSSAHGKKVILRARISLGESRLRLPEGAANAGSASGRVAADIAMRVEEAALIRLERPVYTPQINASGGTEVVLHVWRRGAGLPAKPAAPASFEAFGLIRQGDRLIHATREMRSHLGLAPPQGHNGLSRRSGPETADLALRLAAVLQADPGRGLSSELALTLAFTVLGPLERDRVLPVGFRKTFAKAGLSAPEWNRALRQASPAILRAVLAKAPPLPARMRSYGLVRLQTYNAAAQGFPFHVPLTELLWLPMNQDDGLRVYQDQLPQLLPADEEQAIALLQRLELDSLSGETVAVVLDYRLGRARALARPGGPVTMRELQMVDILMIPEAVHLLEDPAKQSVLASFPFTASPPEVQDTLPAELYLTTADSLWAAVGAMNGGRARLSQQVAQQHTNSGLDKAQNLRHASQETARILALNRERYLIGALYRLEEHDPARGGYKVQHAVRLTPVAHGKDASILNAPRLSYQDQQGYAFLPATPEQARQIEGLLDRERDLAALVEVQPVALGPQHGLIVSRPSRVLAGPAGPRGGPKRIVLTLTVPKRKPLAANPQARLTVPEPLYLDRETVDLLTVKLAPEVMGPPAFRRMLEARLRRERLAAAAGTVPPWGAFFANPDAAASETELAALLPAFTGWSKARASRLPDQFTVPVALQSRHRHPATGCASFGFPDPAGSGNAVSENASRLIGAAPQEAQTARLRTSEPRVPAPGPDRAVVLRGRASHQGMTGARERCGRVSGGARNRTAVAGTDAAAYADALVILRAMPTPGAVGDGRGFRDYTVSADALRFVPLPPGRQDAAGFRGAVVLDGTVTELAVHAGGRGKQTGIVARLKPQDWLAALGTPPKNLDIRGLTLGMSEDAFLERARGLLPQGTLFRSLPQAQPTLYGTAVGLVSQSGAEVLAATLVQGAEGALVTGILYHRRLGAGQATFGGLRKALVEKYGTISKEGAGRAYYWGVPAGAIDPHGICTGTQLFQGRTAPKMQRAGAAGSGGTAADADTGQAKGQAGGRGPAPQFNGNNYGWPSDGNTPPDPAGTEQMQKICGAAVAARLRDRRADGLTLDLWLLDIPRARALAAAAPEPREEIDLDL